MVYRMRKKTLLLMFSLLILICSMPISVLANPDTTFVKTNNPPNVQIKATYSNDLAVDTEGDWFCITYKRELNANEDPKTEDISNFSINTAKGLSGYIKPGWYDVIGINYEGMNPALKGQKVAIPTLIRTYDDNPVTIPIAIGEQAVVELQNEIGSDKVYVEENGISEHTSYSSSVGLNPVGQTPESPFVDPTVFGDDEEAREEYYEYLYEEGFVDENRNPTAKTNAMMESLEAMNESETTYETLQPEVVDDTVPTPGSDVEIDEYDGSYDSEDYDYSSDYGEEIKEERFDQKPEEDIQTEKPVESSHPWLTKILTYLPKVVMIGLTIIIGIWIIKKK